MNKKKPKKSKYKIYFWHLTRKWYDGHDRNSDLMCMIWFKLYSSWQQKITSSTLFYLIVSITVIHHMRNEVSNIPYLRFDARKEFLDQCTRILWMKINLILMNYNFRKISYFRFIPRFTSILTILISKRIISLTLQYVCTSKIMTNDQTEVSTHAISTYLYVSVPNKSKMKLKSVLFHPFEKIVEIMWWWCCPQWW